MCRTFAFVALLAVVAIATAETVAESKVEDSSKTYYYKPVRCPCKCFTGHKVYKAAKQCNKSKYYYKCSVSKCQKGYYYSGQWCCDKTTPTTPPTPPTQPPTTKPPTTKPSCPCYCTTYHWASKACYYKPYCKVSSCGYDKYKCCY